MEKYIFVEDLTSDVMFEAYGKNLDELLANSALAMFEIVCQIDKIKPEKSIDVKVEADNIEDLVHSWLSILLSEAEISELFLNKFEVSVKKNTKYIAQGKAYGEPISREKGETVVKGVTYYNFKVEKTKEGFKATVVLDI